MGLLFPLTSITLRIIKIIITQGDLSFIPSLSLYPHPSTAPNLTQILPQAPFGVDMSF